MLILSRKKSEAIRVGDDIVIRILKTGSHVHLGIEAPSDVLVLRSELLGKSRERSMARRLHDRLTGSSPAGNESPAM